MEKRKRKAVEEILLISTNEALHSNEIDLTKKTANSVKKFIKQIAKKIAKKKNGFSYQIENEADFNSKKIKTYSDSTGSQ